MHPTAASKIMVDVIGSQPPRPEQTTDVSSMRIARVPTHRVLLPRTGIGQCRRTSSRVHRSGASGGEEIFFPRLHPIRGLVLARRRPHAPTTLERTRATLEGCKPRPEEAKNVPKARLVTPFLTIVAHIILGQLHFLVSAMPRDCLQHASHRHPYDKANQQRYEGYISRSEPGPRSDTTYASWMRWTWRCCVSVLLADDALVERAEKHSKRKLKTRQLVRYPSCYLIARQCAG